MHDQQQLDLDVARGPTVELAGDREADRDLEDDRPLELVDHREEPDLDDDEDMDGWFEPPPDPGWRRAALARMRGAAPADDRRFLPTARDHPEVSGALPVPRPTGADRGGQGRQINLRLRPHQHDALLAAADAAALAPTTLARTLVVDGVRQILRDARDRTAEEQEARVRAAEARAAARLRVARRP